MRPPLRLAATGKEASSASAPDEAELLKLEAIYCSYGDTVHYAEPPKIFERCEGSLPLRRATARRILDLQMWYSAVNFGYANPRLNDALQAPARHAAAGREPVSAPREDRARRRMIAQRRRSRSSGRKGRVHFNVGGSQAVEDSLKLVRNASERQEPDVRVRGRLSRPHARRLGDHLVLSLPPPLRPLRRPRPVRAVPVSLPRPQGHEQGGVRRITACAQFARLFETEYNGVWDPKAGQCRIRRVLRRADPGHRRLRHPADELLHRAEEGARPATASCWWSTRSRWASSAPASCGRSSISA